MGTYIDREYAPIEERIVAYTEYIKSTQYTNPLQIITKIIIYNKKLKKLYLVKE